MDPKRTQPQNRPGTIPIWTTVVVLVGISVASPARGQGNPAPLDSSSRPVSSRLKQLASDRGQEAGRGTPAEADVAMSGTASRANSPSDSTNVVESIDRAPVRVHGSPRLMVPPPAPVDVITVPSPTKNRPDGWLFGLGRPRDSGPAERIGAPRQAAPKERPAATDRQPARASAAEPSADIAQHPTPEAQRPTAPSSARSKDPVSLRASARGLFSDHTAQPSNKQSGSLASASKSQPSPPATTVRLGSESKSVSKGLAARMSAAQESVRGEEQARVLPIPRNSTDPVSSTPSERGALPPPSAPAFAAAETAGSTQHGAGYPISTENLPVPVAIGEVAATAELPSYTDSFYPTGMETYYLGRGIEYPRNYGSGTEPPDFIAQSQAGLAPYRNPGSFDYASGAVHDTDVENPYNRFFEPVADLARPFLSRDALVYEKDTSTYGLSAVADVDLPFLTRSFVPDRANLKAGPIFLDVLSLGSGLLYSDFTGSDSFIGFPEGQADGLLSYVSLRTRSLVRITPNVYLTMASTLIYLPQENRLGLGFPDGFQYGPLARVNWERRAGNWDIQVYDTFRVLTGLSYFADLQTDAFQRAGRYQFGFFGADRRFQDSFNLNRVHFTNAVGARASTPVRLFNDDWRWWLDASHSDFWQSYSFDKHSYRDSFSTLLAYDGNYLPFLPTFGYNTFSNDSFETSAHRANIQGKGRLTENITLTAMTGLGWTAGFEKNRQFATWDIGLAHAINQRMSQRFWYGNDLISNDFSDATAVGKGLGYTLTSALTPQISSSLTFGVSDGENLTSDLQVHRELYGMNFDYRPLDYTRVRLGAFFENSDSSKSASDEFNRWIYYTRLTQQIASRTNLNASYQFEDTDYFMEHLYRMGVTRYF